jgi:hypothetical protein
VVPHYTHIIAHPPTRPLDHAPLAPVPFRGVGLTCKMGQRVCVMLVLVAILLLSCTGT